MYTTDEKIRLIGPWFLNLIQQIYAEKLDLVTHKSVETNIEALKNIAKEVNYNIELMRDGDDIVIRVVDKDNPYLQSLLTTTCNLYIREEGEE